MKFTPLVEWCRAKWQIKNIYHHNNRWSNAEVLSCVYYYYYFFIIWSQYLNGNAWPAYRYVSSWREFFSLIYYAFSNNYSVNRHTWRASRAYNISIRNEIMNLFYCYTTSFEAKKKCWSKLISFWEKHFFHCFRDCQKA